MWLLWGGRSTAHPVTNPLGGHVDHAPHQQSHWNSSVVSLPSEPCSVSPVGDDTAAKPVDVQRHTGRACPHCPPCGWSLGQEDSLEGNGHLTSHLWTRNDQWRPRPLLVTLGPSSKLDLLWKLTLRICFRVFGEMPTDHTHSILSSFQRFPFLIRSSLDSSKDQQT